MFDSFMGILLSSCILSGRFRLGCGFSTPGSKACYATLGMNGPAAMLGTTESTENSGGLGSTGSHRSPDITHRGGNPPQ